MTVSLWRRSGRLGTIDCECAIIGAGIMGISCATALERRGIDALIIDKGGIGAGASTRNAGFLMRGAADNYAAGIRDWGRDLARFVWKLTEDNLAMLRREGIQALPGYRSVPSCLLALTSEEADELRESARLMREDGFDVSIAESGKDAAWRSGKVICGLMNPGDGACNSHEVLIHLAAKLRRPPMLHQEVASLTIESPDRIRITTQDAIIRARRAIIATNAYTPLLLPRLGELILPKRGQILAFKTASPMFDCSYYANHGGEYFRQPTPDTAIIGGWRRHFADTEVGYDDRTTEGIQRGLESFITQFVPSPLDVVARWSGVMGFTPDGLPLVGPIDASGSRAERSPLWLAAGCTGHGMSMFFRTAHLAVESLLDGGENRFALTRRALNR
jgi:gamma-glutamylputrescine oxidase